MGRTFDSSMHVQRHTVSRLRFARSVRGLRKVQGEWALVCLALNMKRMQGLQAA